MRFVDKVYIKKNVFSAWLVVSSHTGVAGASATH